MAPKLATRFWHVAIALVTAALCVRDSSTQIVPLTDNTQYAQSSPNITLRWNAVSRALVKKNLVDPLWAARTYAILSVAQNDAARAVQQLKADRGEEKLFIKATVASSSATALAHLFPHKVPRISAYLGEDLLKLENRHPKIELARAVNIGKAVALSLIRKRENDGSIRLETKLPPPGPAVWQSSEQWAPLRPFWGEVQPFVVKRLEDYDLSPPPSPDSPEFFQALAAVRDVRKAASGYNEDIARKWADGPGTATPRVIGTISRANLLRATDLTNRKAPGYLPT